MEHARIGPNSIIRTVEALTDLFGVPYTHNLLCAGGYPDLMDNLPTTMIPEEEFLALITMLVEQIGSEQTAHILRRAGELTAGYLLANRIPKPFQTLLTYVSPTIGLNLLLVAIKKSAWTFAGSGKFSFVGSTPATIIIANQHATAIIPHEICSFYNGTFETIFQTLIDTQTHVEKLVGPGSGEFRCVYRVWYGRSASQQLS
jgi:divinyl protochlorophyllide a 8-vinyl-reductase